MHQFLIDEDNVGRKRRTLFTINKPRYWKPLQNEMFCINEDKLIQIKILSKLDKKNHWVWLVPYMLISKLMDFAHHNPFLQHFGALQTFNNLETRF